MKKTIMLMLVLFVVIISGCKSDNGGEEQESPFIGGTQGIDINFEPGAPISEFGQDDLVDVKVKLINFGEFEIPTNSAKVKLYGVSPIEFDSLNLDSYTILESSLFPAEKGISEAGGEVIVDLGQIDYAGSISGGFVEKELLAKVCYPYQTKASVEACITSKTLEEIGSENICNTGGEKIKKGYVSGGPVQITSFKEELRGVNQVAFKISLKNKGLGTIYNKEKECEDFESAYGKLQNKNKVYVELKPEIIKCTFSGGQNYGGYLTLQDGEEKILTCLLDVDQEAKYTQNVDIFVDYKYIDTTSTNIKILGNQ